MHLCTWSFINLINFVIAKSAVYLFTMVSTWTSLPHPIFRRKYFTILFSQNEDRVLAAPPPPPLDPRLIKNGNSTWFQCDHDFGFETCGYVI